MEVLRTLDPDSVDACVTDPPYGLAFMGKHWDRGVPDADVWREVYRVLKPGAHLLSFFGTRTYHRGVVAIEDAGFEIRDQIGWLYAQGFPKNLDVAYELHKKAQQAAEHDVRFVLSTHLQAPVYACHQCGQVLLAPLSEQGASQRWRSWSEPKLAGAEQSSLEGWSHMEAAEGELWRCEVCSMSHGVFVDGAERRLHHGAPASDGSVHGAVAQTDGGGASHRQEPEQQRPEQFDAVQVERRAQALRGYGSSLKPAWEPIVLARKPLDGTVAANVLKWGTGGLNIDGCRVEGAKRHPGDYHDAGAVGGGRTTGHFNGSDRSNFDSTKGRFPANIIHDGSDEVLADFAKYGESKSNSGIYRNRSGMGIHDSPKGTFGKGDVEGGYDDTGTAARFFYTAKASKDDRNDGLWDYEHTDAADMVDRKPDSAGMNSPRAGAGRTSGARNHHPTVKPTSLMRYLVRLVTPKGGLVLDPFAGSGTTLIAAYREDCRAIGIELEKEYFDMAQHRIDRATAQMRLAL